MGKWLPMVGKHRYKVMIYQLLKLIFFFNTVVQFNMFIKLNIVQVARFKAVFYVYTKGTNECNFIDYKIYAMVKYVTVNICIFVTINHKFSVLGQNGIENLI